MPKQYLFHADAGHGWLKVPKADMLPSKISRISRFSYQDESHFYLEEDCDAALAPQDHETIFKNDGDYSPVRNLPRVNPKTYQK